MLNINEYEIIYNNDPIKELENIRIEIKQLEQYIKEQSYIEFKLKASIRRHKFVRGSIEKVK